MSMSNTSYSIKPRYCFFVFLLQYVNELLLLFAISPIYPNVLLFDRFQRSGEYRSRTDDLLRARQAL